MTGNGPEARLVVRARFTSYDGHLAELARQPSGSQKRGDATAGQTGPAPMLGLARYPLVSLDDGAPAAVPESHSGTGRSRSRLP